MVRTHGNYHFKRIVPIRFSRVRLHIFQTLLGQSYLTFAVFLCGKELLLEAREYPARPTMREAQQILLQEELRIRRHVGGEALLPAWQENAQNGVRWQMVKIGGGNGFEVHSV